MKVLLRDPPIGPAYMCGNERVSAYVHENMCVCICIHASACVGMRVSLCRSVSESGCSHWGSSLASLRTGHLAGLHLGGVHLLSACRTLGSPLSHPFTQSPTCRSPQGFIFIEEGSSLFPNTPTMHCKVLGRGDWGAWRGRAVTGWTVAF